MSQEQLINVIGMIAIFGLVFSIWCICIILWFGKSLSRLKTVQKRLGITREESDESHTLRLWRETQQKTLAAYKGQKLTLQERIEQFRRSAGWKTSVYTVVLGVIAAAICGFAGVYFFTGRITWAVGTFLGILLVFWYYTQHCISKISALLERQLVDALGISARALRAGHPLLGAFQMITEEIDEPISDIFFRICQEQMLGLDLKDSIQKVARGSFNNELKFFATAVGIQLQSGGNLADLMDSIANVIRARIKLNNRVRVMTAQTRFNKNVLISLPIIMFFLMDILNPEYMGPLYTTNEGRILLIVTTLSIMFGAWIMNRMCILTLLSS